MSPAMRLTVMVWGWILRMWVAGGSSDRSERWPEKGGSAAAGARMEVWLGEAGREEVLPTELVVSMLVDEDAAGICDEGRAVCKLKECS